MSDRIKEIEEQIVLAKDDYDRIDLRNEMAWELRLSDIKQSLSIAEETYQSARILNYNKGMAAALRTQANAHQALYQFDLSFQKGIESLEHYRSINDKQGEASAIALLGRNSFLLGDFENALKYYLLSLQIRELLKDTSGIVSMYTNVGNIYGIKKDYSNALNYFLKGLEMGKSIPDSQSKAIILGNIGSVYGLRKEFDKALEYYFECMKLTEGSKANNDYTPNYANIAEAFLMQGKLIEAEKYYAKSLLLAESTGNKVGEALSLLGFGSTYIKLKSLDKALACLEKALGIAPAYTDKNILAEIYLALSELYVQKEDYAKALDYHKKFYSEKEQLFTEEAEKKTQNLLILHQVETLKKESEEHRISNDELKKLNEEIENSNRRIMESIDYAKHIQDSILPHATSLKQYFPDSFVFQKPKDIISGDFFWMYEKENEVLLAAVDCTGHGVSGALMSVVANSLLSQVTANQWMPNPSFILNELNHYMQRTLAAHDESGLRDSMDIAMCSINKTKNELLFAGAHNPLYLFSDGLLTEYKGDTISMGNSAVAKFTNHRIKLKKGDCLYIFTDGFADQKGGHLRKKFYYEPFKNLLLDIHTEPMDKQKALLDKTMYEWMGNELQIDDMLIIGIRI
ncbi:MAG: tetratricopeptide repeat protein [Bacteroidia bacterium]|nr:tetratricopeptide repeat protein [Bacteroidia bacterium]